MGFLDRLLGRQNQPETVLPDQRSRQQRAPVPGGNLPPDQLTDEQALERYRYLLRTAPPEAIEQAHAEAFAQLTADQRRLVLEQLSADVPANERTDRDDPQSLARLATRAELRRPGTLERSFGNIGPAGVGMGGLMAGSFLSTIAGVVIGTAIADAVFNDSGNDQGSADGSDAGQDDQNADTGDAADAGNDNGGGDFGGGDFGGGDFGGGDFGGGDFGGDF